MGTETAGEISLDQALAWLLDDRPCVPFAGAAISLAVPSGAPGVGAVIEATIDTLRDVAGLTEANLATNGNAAAAPDGKPKAPFTARLLPESCYGAIASVTGNADHLRLWEAYAWRAEDDDATAPRPNLGHHLLVWLAHRHGTPVITTNFDCYLEEAARAQGLQPVVSCPERNGPFRPKAATTGQVSIWKLHGSADQVQTLRSQAADLVRSSYPALARLLGQRPRMLIVGYSGRDFDIFPLMAHRRAGADVLWVDMAWRDPHTGRAHRALSLAGCQRLTAAANDLAFQFWEQNMGSPACAAAVPAVRRCQAAPAAASDQVKKEFLGRVRDSARTQIRAAVADGPLQARVALAATANTVADFPLTARLLTPGVIEDDGSGRGRMILHLALSSMDRHDDALACAKEARRVAARQRDVLAWGRAELAVTFSQSQRFASTFYEPELRRHQPPKHKVAGAGIRMLSDAVLLSPLFASAALLLRRRAEGSRHYAALEFASDYVEHLIRITAVGTAAIGKLTRQRGRVLTVPLWIGVGRLAVRVGYMRGYLNVVKYRARGGPIAVTAGNDIGQTDTQAILSASIVGDSVAEAIAYRDAAHTLLKESESTVNAEERDRFRSEASHLIAESRRRGDLCGSPSLVLKCLLLAREYGLPGAVPAEASEIDDLARQLQGDANKKIEQEIIRMLAAPPVDVPDDKVHS